MRWIGMSTIAQHDANNDGILEEHLISLYRTNSEQKPERPV
ncbi:hypothetical protein BIWAKO_06274 [Bosea sp. BIWAKO-01]|nr:hypothetical protein BIWAKO_06274 [Bosea sp. BIWAKO-01]